MNEGLIVYLVCGQEIPEPLISTGTAVSSAYRPTRWNWWGRARGGFSVTGPRCCSTASASMMLAIFIYFSKLTTNNVERGEVVRGPVEFDNLVQVFNSFKLKN
jgi:hypothetical protein